MKSKDLLKLMFDDNKITEKQMALIWQTMRKGDLETRNSLLGILNEIYFNLSYKNMEFMVKQLGEVDPKLLVQEEIELIYKIVTFSRFKSDCPEGVEPRYLEVDRFDAGRCHKNLLACCQHCRPAESRDNQDIIDQNRHAVEESA